MDINTLRSVVTVVVMGAFFGILWWAYRPGHKARFERDAMLPFDESGDDASGNGDTSKGSRP